MHRDEKQALFSSSLFPLHLESVRTFLFCEKVMLVIQGERFQKAGCFLLLPGKKHCLLQVPQAYLRRRGLGQEMHSI